MNNIFRIPAAIILLGCMMVWAEPAKITKLEKLREKPFIDAKVLLKLSAGQKVEIDKRQGSWYSIKALGKTGWAPMLSVRRTQQAATASSGSLTQVSTGRTSGTGVVSTTGVRGLNEEQLKMAAFSDSAVSAAEKLRTPADSALSFARAGTLSGQKVPPLVLKTAKGGAQ